MTPGPRHIVALALAAGGCLSPRPVEPPPRLGYVAVAESGKVVAIDFNDWSLVREYSGFAAPHGAVVTPDGAEIYVTSFDVDQMAVVDVASGGVSRMIEMGSTTHHLRTSPDGETIYVTLGRAGAAAFVARHTDEVLASVPCGKSPFDLVLSPDGANLFVANTSSNDVAKIDASKKELLAVVPTGEGPTHLVVTSDSSTLYVTNESSGTVSEVDTAAMTKLRDFEVGVDVHGVALSPDEAILFASGWEGRITAITRATGERHDLTVPAGDTHGLWFSPDGKHLLICDILDNRMVVLDPGSLAEEAVVQLPPSPHQISFPTW